MWSQGSSFCYMVISAKCWKQFRSNVCHSSEKVIAISFRSLEVSNMRREGKGREDKTREGKGGKGREEKGREGMEENRREGKGREDKRRKGRDEQTRRRNEKKLSFFNNFFSLFLFSPLTIGTTFCLAPLRPYLRVVSSHSVRRRDSARQLSVPHSPPI